LIQSSMIYAAPAMGGTSVFVFTLHLYLVLRQSIGKVPPKRPRLRLIIMLSAPYVAYFIMFVVAMFSGYSRAEKVHRSSLYCTIGISAVTSLSGGISAVAILAAVIIETLTVITVHQHWLSFRRGKSGITMSILIRTSILLFFSLVAFGTCMVFLANLTSVIPNFVLAILPVATFIVFGTQLDFMQVWFSCCLPKKNLKKRPQSESFASIASESSTGPIVPPKEYA